MVCAGEKGLTANLAWYTYLRACHRSSIGIA